MPMKPNEKLSVGSLHVNTYGDRFEIIEYINNKNILIKFITPVDYTKWVAGKEILNSNVNSPYTKTVCGVGYLGEGDYSAYINCNEYTREYKIWSDMLRRCYTGIGKIAYQDVFVCEEWHNFQNFAKWCNSQLYFNIFSCYQLDKDILRKGNKIYSHEFCRFIPSELNKVFISRRNFRGPYPIGVCLNNNRYKKYSSIISIDGERKSLGNFYNEQDAFLAYKHEKEQYIKSKAAKFRGVIDLEIYEALMNWSIEEDD